MSYLRDQVIVLKKIPYRDYDRYYLMYGLRHGLLAASARGASKPSSKQAGTLEPLNYAEVMIAKGRSYDHLAVATSARNDLRPRSLAAFCVLGAFAELTLGLIQPGVADERIFFLWQELSAALSILSNDSGSDRAMLAYSSAILRLLDLLGYSPALAPKCGVCGTYTEQAVWCYGPDSNHLICSSCRKLEPRPVLDLDHNILLLAAFIRRTDLKDVMRLTASLDDLRRFATLIRLSLAHAPLSFEPRGFKAIVDICKNPRA